MPEVTHDATVALRLELGRMTDKANALEAALHKEVLAIVRQTMYEKARLEAVVEKLKEENEVLQNRCDFLEGRGQS